jgi:Na+-driven multidrug efflux pump
MTPTFDPQLLTGDTAKTLRRLASPVLAAYLMAALVGLADAYFVSSLGDGALAALGFALPTTGIALQLLIAGGVAVTAIIAPSVGRGDLARARVELRHALLIGVAACVLLLALALPAGVWLRDRLGGGSVATLAYEYLSTWSLGLGFVLITLWGTATLRVTGDVRTSSVAFTLQALLNLTSNPLLIFGYGPLPGLGLRGAALASVLSYAIAASFTLWRLRSYLFTRDAQRGPSLREVGRSLAAVAWLSMCSRSAWSRFCWRRTARMRWRRSESVRA